MSAIEHAHDTLGKGHRIIAEQDKRARTMEAGVDLRQVERERELGGPCFVCARIESFSFSVHRHRHRQTDTHTHHMHNETYVLAVLLKHAELSSLVASHQRLSTEQREMSHRLQRAEADATAAKEEAETLRREKHQLTQQLEVQQPPPHTHTYTHTHTHTHAHTHTHMHTHALSH